MPSSLRRGRNPLVNRYVQWQMLGSILMLVLTAQGSGLPPRYVPATWEQIQAAIPENIRIPDKQRPTRKAAFAEIRPYWERILSGDDLVKAEAAFGQRDYPLSYLPVLHGNQTNRAATLLRLERDLRLFSPQIEFHSDIHLVREWNQQIQGCAARVRQLLEQGNLEFEWLRRLLEAMDSARDVDTNLQYGFRDHLYERIGELTDPGSEALTRYISEDALAGNLNVLKTVRGFARLTSQHLSNCVKPAEKGDWQVSEEYARIKLPVRGARPYSGGLDVTPSDRTLRKKHSARAREEIRRVPNSLGLLLVQDYARRAGSGDRRFPHEPQELLRWPTPGDHILESCVARREWNLTRAMLAIKIYSFKYRSMPRSFSDLISDKLLDRVPFDYVTGDPLPFKPMIVVYVDNEIEVLLMEGWFWEDSYRRVKRSWSAYEPKEPYRS